MMEEEKRLWLELYDLERQGVFEDRIICVTHYVPNAPWRKTQYTKILYDEGGGVVHRHVLRGDEKWVWEQWERTKRYRAVRRRLAHISGGWGGGELSNVLIYGKIHD